jgi:hypothetical protein
MAGGDIGGTMSKKVAFVFVFNLIVGMGALGMPQAFHEAGVVMR